ncbi:MAG: HdeD family acid-resistance protein [Acutalibacteraceae bacterium]
MDIKKKFKKFRIGAIALSIACIIFGILLICLPNFSLKVLCFVLGGLSLCTGIANIISYFSKYDFEKFYHMGLAGGIIFTIIGFFLIFRSNMVTDFLVIIIGLLVFINSIIRLPGAFDLRRAGVRFWWIAASLSILSAILGMIMFCTPYDFKSLIIILVGCSFVVEGASDLYWSLYISKKIKIMEQNKSLKENIIDVEFEDKK